MVYCMNQFYNKQNMCMGNIFRNINMYGNIEYVKYIAEWYTLV